LFIEFALLKSQVGKKDDALKILNKLIDGQSVLLEGKPIYLNTKYKASYTAIYKNMVEILIESDHKYALSIHYIIFIPYKFVILIIFFYLEKKH